MQESYLKVWRHAASYDPAIASPMTWMATIVRHGAIDALRKRQIEAFTSDDEMSALPSNDPDPVDEMHLARLRPKALAAFARLPEDKRRLIMLAYLRDRSRHDLSIRLGIPANTVKTHLRRALLELRATMFASIEARTQGGVKSPMRRSPPRRRSAHAPAAAGNAHHCFPPSGSGQRGCSPGLKAAAASAPDNVASRACRIATNAASVTPSRRWTLFSRCSPTVVSQA